MTRSGPNSPWPTRPGIASSCRAKAAGSVEGAERVGDQAAVRARRDRPELDGVERPERRGDAERQDLHRHRRREPVDRLVGGADDDEAVRGRRDHLLAHVRPAAALDDPAVGSDLVGAVDHDVEPLERLERLDRQRRAPARPSRWRSTSPRSAAAGCRLASAGSRCATVEPVPSPTAIPSSTSSAAASAATRFSCSRGLRGLSGLTDLARADVTRWHTPQSRASSEALGY